jgi:hypothetical protein
MKMPRTKPADFPRFLPIMRSILPLIFIFLAIESRAIEYPEFDKSQLSWLGEQIYNNECSRQSDCLTSWNAGEDFPSLGIGHFIWYQSDQEEIFEETFPLLLAFLESRAIASPSWIIEAGYNSPWRTRQRFLDDFCDPRLVDLRSFLLQHITEQTQFIVQRFEKGIARIIESSEKTDQEILETRFLQVANASPPYGLYALIDYVNFKGEGISPLERYKGQGWGLKQVLENMSNNGIEPLQQFIISAQQTLELRVYNSPDDRDETRWIRGWTRRLNTYQPASFVDQPASFVDQPASLPAIGKP